MMDNPGFFKITEEEKMAVAASLGRAVSFKTVSSRDQTQVDWSEFDRFHDYLRQQFPGVFLTLKFEVVGRANLLFEWVGSDPGLESVLLTAHQDVVPAKELEKWEHGPFSGEIADGFVWGRGSFDVKIQIVAILSAVEKLVGEGFQPKRSVFLGFGSNEEVTGDGAVLIARKLAERGRKFYMVLDEGGAVMETLMKQIHSHVAVIGVAEKGHLNVKLTVRKHGGHSSTPDNPTALGILGRALARVEKAQQGCHVEPPMKWFFKAVATNTKGFYSFLFRHFWLTRPLVLSVFKANPQYAAFIRTTHAATMCQGSSATNVISDEAWAVVNFRLLSSDNADTIIEWLRKVIRDDRVSYEVIGEAVMQSPVSPVDCPQFELLKAVVECNFEDTVAVPYFMSGGSDARHYTGISDNVYRFTPALLNFNELGRMHGCNERLSVENAGRAMGFYLSLITSL